MNKDEEIPLRKAFQLNKWSGWEENELLFSNIEHKQKGNLHLYNYGKNTLVDRNNPVIMKCRGLVVDDEGKVLNYPFERFFNDFEKEKTEIDWSTAEAQEKLDGCVSRKTKINLPNGKTKEIISFTGPRKNWVGKKILGYNFQKEKIEETEILGVSKKKALNKKWVKIEFINEKIIQCTEDHLIYCQRGWIEAKNLKKDDELLQVSNVFNNIQEQILIGTLLGDAYISKHPTGSKITISQKEKKYVELKARFFENIGGTYDIRISGYGTKMHRYYSHINPLFDKYYNLIWNENKRVIKDELLNKLSLFSLAIWYMDDGSRAHNSKQRDRAILDVSRYNLNDIKKIVKFFQKKFKYKISIQNYKKKYYKLVFNTESSQSFFKSIKTYVPSYMSRKLPEEFRTVYKYFDKKKKVDWQYKKYPLKIKSIKNIAKQSEYFDIQTTLGNFFANGILIHNSLINVWWNGTQWEITTRGNFYPSENGDFDKWFRKLFNKFDLLSKYCCYMFELCSFSNRIITFYDEEFVVLIGARFLDGYYKFQEFNQILLDLVAKELGVRRPKRYLITDLNSCKKLFEELKEDDEGLVIVDDEFNRIKLKQESYIKLSKIKMLKPKDLFEYMLGRIELDQEYIKKCPEVIKELETMKIIWEAYTKVMRKIFEEIKPLAEKSRKDFALKAVDFKHSAWLFAMLDGKTIDKVVNYDQVKDLFEKVD